MLARIREKVGQEIWVGKMTTSPTAKENAKEIQFNRELLLKISKTLFGNGEKGMDEDVRIIKRDLDETNKRVGAIESDVKEIKVMLQEVVGYSGVRYDKDNHPHRRVGDEKRADDDANELLDWIRDKVLPGLVQNAITAIFTIIILLAVIHWADIF